MLDISNIQIGIGVKSEINQIELKKLELFLK